MKWCRHRKTKTRSYQLLPPYDNIFVGNDPTDGMTRKYADQFDALVNVSDTMSESLEPSRLGQIMHWSPVHEGGRWNYSYLYWLKKIMDFHYDAGHKIYLHCHAGAYRSPSAAVLWLMSRGLSQRAADRIDHDKPKYSLSHMWRRHKQLPPQVDLFFKIMRKHPDYDLASILEPLSKKEPFNSEIHHKVIRNSCLMYRIFWWYYRPRHWLRAQKTKIGYFFKKHGYHESGACTWIYNRKHFWAWPRNAEPRDEKDRERLKRGKKHGRRIRSASN